MEESQPETSGRWASCARPWGLAVLGLALANPTVWGAAGNLVIRPEAVLSVTGLYSGPLSVSSQVYTVSNAGVSSLLWSVGRDRPWISLSQSGGTLSGGASAELTVLINSKALDLPVTNDVGTLTFINQNTFDTDLRQVTLGIGPAAAGTALPQLVIVPNQGEMTLTGVPGSTYKVEDAPAVVGPWNPVETNVFAATTAKFEFSATPGQRRFYRSVSSGPGAVAAHLSVARTQKLDNSIVLVTGDVNGVYVVEGSTNGVDWISVHTNKVPASGEFLCTNSVFAATASVAYRAVPARGLDLPVLRHILIAGESMAVGFDGVPPLSVESYGNNHRFYSDVAGANLNPLIETGFETIASGAANHVAWQAPLENLLTSNIGKNGAIYEQQKKGTPLYELGLTQFRDAPQAVAYEMFRYLPGAIFVVGGEGDERNTNFGPNVRQWQADYQKDIQFLTGFTGIIPMFHSQISAWTSPYAGSLPTVSAPFDLLVEAEANPDLTVLVCPRYFFPYAGAGASFPGLHLSNAGYRWMGEYYGKVYKKVLVDGGTWTPLKPATVTRAATTVTAVFSVPVPPLVLDTTRVTDPGNFGFEFYDGSASPPSIASVSLAGPDTVVIQLSRSPTGPDERLRYAYRGISGNPGGPTTGPRGNLRDSDDTPSLYGNTLYNWCVHFEKRVN